MAELQGKTAWVTGAGTGIGEAGALALARAGAAVVLTGRREEPLRRVAAAIEAAGGRTLVEPGDMTDPAQIDRIVAAVRERRAAGRSLTRRASTRSSTATCRAPSTSRPRSCP